MHRQMRQWHATYTYLTLDHVRYEFLISCEGCSLLICRQFRFLNNTGFAPKGQELHFLHASITLNKYWWQDFFLSFCTNLYWSTVRQSTVACCAAFSEPLTLFLQLARAVFTPSRCRQDQGELSELEQRRNMKVNWREM